MSSADPRPLRKYFYVRCKQMFEELDGGLVRVTDEDGRTGVFTWDGHFNEGELTTVNEHMLLYVGGPRVPRVCNYRWTEIEADTERPTGWPEQLEDTVAHQMGKR